MNVNMFILSGFAVWIALLCLGRPIAALLILKNFSFHIFNSFCDHIITKVRRLKIEEVYLFSPAPLI